MYFEVSSWLCVGFETVCQLHLDTFISMRNVAVWLWTALGSRDTSPYRNCHHMRNTPSGGIVWVGRIEWNKWPGDHDGMRGGGRGLNPETRSRTESRAKNRTCVQNVVYRRFTGGLQACEGGLQACEGHHRRGAGTLKCFSSYTLKSVLLAAACRWLAGSAMLPDSQFVCEHNNY